MYCHNCGKENSGADSVCVYCGAPLAASSVITMEPPVLKEEEVLVQPLDNGGPGLEAPSAYPADDGEPEQPDKRRPKGPWKALLITAAVLVVLAFSAQALLLRAAPKLSVDFALDNTLSDLEKRFEGSPYQLLPILYDCYMDGKTDIGFSYSDDIAVTGTLSFACRYADKAFEMAADMNLAGTPIKLDALMNKQRLAVQTSLLDEKYYGVTFGSFDSDIEKFAQVAYLDDQTVAMLKSYFKYLNHSINMDEIDFYEQYQVVFDEFFKSLDTQTVTESVSFGGEAVKCAKVTYTITKENLIRLARQYYEMLAADENVKEAIIYSFEMQESFGAGYGDPEQLYQDTLEEIKNGIDEFEQLYSGNIAFSFYIHNYKVLQMAFNAASQWDGQSVNAELLINFGKDPEKDDIRASAVLTGDGEEPVTGELLFHSAQEGAVYQDRISLVYDDGYDSGEAAVKTTWDKGSGGFTLASEDGSWEIGGSLMVQEDRFTLELKDVLDDFSYYGEDLDLTLSATPEANIPDPDYVNLDKWDEDFLNMVGSAMEESGLGY